MKHVVVPMEKGEERTEENEELGVGESNERVESKEPGIPADTVDVMRENPVEHTIATDLADKGDETSVADNEMYEKATDDPHGVIEPTIQAQEAQHAREIPTYSEE